MHSSSRIRRRDRSQECAPGLGSARYSRCRTQFPTLGPFQPSAHVPRPTRKPDLASQNVPAGLPRTIQDCRSRIDSEIRVPPETLSHENQDRGCRTGGSWARQGWTVSLLPDHVARYGRDNGTVLGSATCPSEIAQSPLLIVIAECTATADQSRHGPHVQNSVVALQLEFCKRLMG